MRTENDFIAGLSFEFFEHFRLKHCVATFINELLVYEFARVREMDSKKTSKSPESGILMRQQIKNRKLIGSSSSLGTCQF